MSEKIVDLTDSVPEDQTVLEILKPGGVESTGWTVTLAGPGHPKAVAHADIMNKKSLRRQSQQEAQAANGKKVKPDDRTVEEVRQDNVQWVISRIVTWTPVSVFGKTYRYSDETATELLLNPRMGWALQQLVDAIVDERSFMPRSAMNSGRTQSESSASAQLTMAE